MYLPDVHVARHVVPPYRRSWICVIDIEAVASARETSSRVSPATPRPLQQESCTPSRSGRAAREPTPTVAVPSVPVGAAARARSRLPMAYRRRPAANHLLSPWRLRRTCVQVQPGNCKHLHLLEMRRAPCVERPSCYPSWDPALASTPRRAALRWYRMTAAALGVHPTPDSSQRNASASRSAARPGLGPRSFRHCEDAHALGPSSAVKEALALQCRSRTAT